MTLKRPKLGVNFVFGICSSNLMRWCRNVIFVKNSLLMFSFRGNVIVKSQST